MHTFEKELRRKIYANAYNNLTDNWDKTYLGELTPESAKVRDFPYTHNSYADIIFNKENGSIKNRLATSAKK